MLKLMYITNNTSLAALALAAGVDRIFLDLEVLGKFERQGHLDTLISQHTVCDVQAMRHAFPNAELLVRINPVHDRTEQEIEDILNCSPQFIMLPMYKTLQEVLFVSKILNRRAALIPLLETPEALQIIDDICLVSGVSEMYLGMNDLHLALGRKFMFEFLADGTVDHFCNTVRKYGKNFGFGGIARVGEGVLPAEYIIGEHERLGSSSVILSRSFHRQASSVSALEAQMNFVEEVQKVRLCEQKFSLRDDDERYKHNLLIKEIVDKNISFLKK